MATPALRVLRAHLPGAFIGGLVRPGLDELLAGLDVLDEVHVDRARGMMGPKHVAAKIRPRKYDTALLLTNSFSTALITRLAFIPRRVGYSRDGRGLLLTDRLMPPRTGGLAGVGIGALKCVPAVEYYLEAARAIVPEAKGNNPRLELGITPAQRELTQSILQKSGVGDGAFAVLNPGGNNPAKRWPAERFGALAAGLARRRGLRVLVNGGPGEEAVCAGVVDAACAAGASEQDVVALTGLGGTIGSLKGLIAQSRLLVTNDTGPRHIAAAFGRPLVTLFGPTDPRWTTLPETGAANIEVLADPTLPAELVADDHPERCAIDRIALDRVEQAVDAALRAD